jgi:hypothetical protein
MKTIKPDYAKLQVDDLMIAYRKHHPKDGVFPVSYDGYDKNWNCIVWHDLEGTTYFENELVFVDESEYDKQRGILPKDEPVKPQKTMVDCWLSPYGEVIKCEPGSWKHAATAAKILNERYGYSLNPELPELGWDDILERKGWCRWTSCTGCGWILRPDVKPTTDQLNKIFELTGYIPDDIW